MKILEDILGMLDERIEQCKENLKDHKSQKSVGFGYDQGSLDEALYIKVLVLDIGDLDE